MKIRFKVAEIVERMESPGQGPIRVRRTKLVPIAIAGARSVSGELEIVEQEPTSQPLAISAEAEADISPTGIEEKKKPKTTGRRKG